ncbi:TIGR03086 family metal-binding protein [Nonomuraea cavernae]|uniref:TIGR03086 family protein n=1 Tax=Nonomuraea cavernae TaxID=2045107 RepID=A0A918DJA3_9ACTN|nr:TIGR03086 family metal-binding protein [Nonomuraea cavernae]MCA2186161.1 TIGR03086 family protein [Nonomuraea cavernae]GGO70026.1 TIGR03086 family protein [Nonomuraea cavernae]
MDLRALDAAALNHLSSLITTISASQLSATTPCAGWNVADLIDHMNREHEAVSSTILGAPLILDADPRSAFAQAIARWKAAFGQPGMLDQEVYVPKYQKRYLGQEILWVHLADMLVHHWDISKAIAVAPDLPAALVAVALPVAQALPVDGPLRGAGSTYAPPVDVPPNASPGDLLVAALGRSPAWRAAEDLPPNRHSHV